MRNGVLGVIGEVVRQVLNSPELDEQAKCTRDQLLDKLEVGRYNGILYSGTVTIYQYVAIYHCNTM